jgi:hypothetical protein
MFPTYDVLTLGRDGSHGVQAGRCGGGTAEVATVRQSQSLQDQLFQERLRIAERLVKTSAGPGTLAN